MTKREFYIFFSIFNIVLVALTLLCTFGSWAILGYLFLLENPPIYSIILYFGSVTIYFGAIIVKILLPFILSGIGRKREKSIIDKFLLYIKENPKEKKWILLSAFIFDLLIMVIFLCLYETLLAAIYFYYFLLYPGGLILFYLMLYADLKTYK